MYKPNQLASGSPNAGRAREAQTAPWKRCVYRCLTVIEVVLLAILFVESMWGAQQYAVPHMLEPSPSQFQYGVAPGIGPGVAP